LQKENSNNWVILMNLSAIFAAARAFQVAIAEFGR
jgi:hypothetical protein